jgi:hypothetical protein
LFFACYEKGGYSLLTTLVCGEELSLGAFLWFGYFSARTLIAVCRAMELDGDKRM